AKNTASKPCAGLISRKIPGKVKKRRAPRVEHRRPADDYAFYFGRHCARVTIAYKPFGTEAYLGMSCDVSL
ncbi:MAG: hypothetical protein Q3X95_06965, partial [Duodenibacillus sp.]|nr:hypothetical protein [Duodenibacillus sp.]